MKNKDNVLDNIPVINDNISWENDENGIVTISIYNKGIFNKIFQLLLKKPKISYIHLDKMGSFIWNIIDGKKSIYDIGVDFEEQFKEEAQPIYERLLTYMNTLSNCKFIKYIN